MDAGLWFGAKTIWFNATFGNEVNSLLSSENIVLHITMIPMGVIPSIMSKWALRNLPNSIPNQAWR